MSVAADWLSSWRALAEKELRGAALSSLAPRRADGLTFDPALGPDAARDEGLPDAPARRSALLVTDRAEHASLGGVEGVWWRADPSPPPGARVTIHEPSVGAHLDGSAIGDALVEAVLIDRVRDVRAGDVVALTAVHERGASVALEVAIGVLAAVLHARVASAPSVRVAVALGPEFFLEIAKLRALRRLTARVLSTLGCPRPLWIAARTSERSLARLDTPTNAIRATVGAAAAMLGGADVVGVSAMDASDRGARLARNVPEILARESSLLAIDDPARGSFAVEALTDRIARDAYAIVVEVERAGGAIASRASLRDRIDRDAEARDAALRSRRIPLVGVSKFPFANDAVVLPSTHDRRDAACFETLRAAPREPVEIIVIGPREAVEARVQFVRELIAVGGLDVAEHGRAAIVCAPDAAFADEVPRVLADLRARGVPAFVAGKPGAHEGALRAAGALGFIALGQDVVAFVVTLRAAMQNGGAA